jgi:predicted RNase H-like HicB family nuclease
MVTKRELFMEIAVVLQPMSGNGYRATISEPFQLTAVGATREEALRNVQGQFEERARQGAEVVILQMALPHRTLPAKPIWPDDEITRNWLDGIAEYRKERDEEADPWDGPAEPAS